MTLTDWIVCASALLVLALAWAVGTAMAEKAQMVRQRRERHIERQQQVSRSSPKTG